MSGTLRRNIADAEASLGLSLAYFSLLAAFLWASDPTMANPNSVGAYFGAVLVFFVVTLIAGVLFVTLLGAPIALGVEFAVQRARKPWIRYAAHFIAGSVVGFAVFSLLGIASLVNQITSSVVIGLACGTAASLGLLTVRAIHRGRDRRTARRAQDRAITP